jgi:PadR family transcriptional regulator PadR
MNIDAKFSPIRKGLLELAVLKIIAAHKVYAADILKQLEPTDFSTQEGTLYPLLSRLRREGAVAYEWIESDAGPPRKYYYLTPAGKSQLKQLAAYLATINKTLKHIGEKI